MIDRLRTPFFIAALVLIAIAVLIEIGATIAGIGSSGNTPGIGLKYLAFVDSVLLFTVGLMGLALLVKERVQARTQGCITLIFSFLLLLGAFVALLLALAELILMLSLLLAVPFGTIAYIAIYGDFAKGTAVAILALLMALKLGFGGCLVAAQQRFIQNKGLVLIFLCSLLGNVIIGFLHGFVPGILVSITDNIAAIIVAIIGGIWAIFLLVGSIGPVLKSLNPSRL